MRTKKKMETKEDPTKESLLNNRMKKGETKDDISKKIVRKTTEKINPNTERVGDKNTKMSTKKKIETKEDPTKKSLLNNRMNKGETKDDVSNKIKSNNCNKTVRKKTENINPNTERVGNKSAKIETKKKNETKENPTKQSSLKTVSYHIRTNKGETKDDVSKKTVRKKTEKINPNTERVGDKNAKMETKEDPTKQFSLNTETNKGELTDTKDDVSKKIKEINCKTERKDVEIKTELFEEERKTKDDPKEKSSLNLSILKHLTWPLSSLNIFSKIKLLMRKHLMWPLFIMVVLLCSYFSVLYIKSKPGRDIAHQIKIIQKSICKNYYNEQLGMVNLEPWKEGDLGNESVRFIQEIYINQVFYTDKMCHTSLLELFQKKPNKYPLRGVLVAEQGAGKTTSVKAMTSEWCRIIPRYGYILSLKYAIDHLYNDGWVWFSWENVVARWPTVMFTVESLPSTPLWRVLDYFFGRNAKEFYKKAFQHIKDKPHPLPELVFAFELRNINEYRNLTEAIIGEMLSIDQNIREGEIERILEKGMNNILLVFDGYDEYTKLKMKGSTMPEADAIIHREHRKNINLMVTTRSWKSDELLNVKRLGFEKVSIAPFELPRDRDVFIGHFFHGVVGEKLIKALDDGVEDIIPQQLQREPRMLLYICNLWKYSKEIRKSRLKNKEMFWDEIWELMRLTYNRKYPQHEMSKEALKLTRRKIGHLALQSRAKEMPFQQFFNEFDDDLGADLFWFGIYGTQTSVEKPWKLLDNEVKQSKDVTANYEPMLQQEAEKIKLEGSGILGWIVGRFKK